METYSSINAYNYAYPYEYNSPSQHWCSRWSYSMPHTQINTMSDQLLAIQENLTRALVQVESAKSSYSRWSGLMASISNQIQELISEESSLVHSPSLSDCLEHFDENVESDLEDELLNCVDKVFDENSQRDVTNSLAPIVAIELSLVSSTVSRGSNFSSGTTQNLHPPKVAIAISSSTVELAYKLFDTPSDMELFAHSYDPNTPIASLPLDIGSRNCKWVDTGQVGGSLYRDVKLFHRFCDILGMSPYLLAKYARKLFVELSDTKIFEVRHGVLHLCNELCEATRNVAEISYATSPEASIGPTFLNASIGFGGFCFPKDILHLSCICECNSIPQYMFLHLPFDPGSERLTMFAVFTTSIPYDILDEETLLVGFVIVDFAQFLRAAPFNILPSATGDLSNSIADFVNHSQSLFTIAEFYICSNEIQLHNIFQLSGHELQMGDNFTDDSICGIKLGVESNGYFTTFCAAYKLLGESIDIFLMYSFAGAPAHIGELYIIYHLRHFSCGTTLEFRNLYHALPSKTGLWVNGLVATVLEYVMSSQMVNAKLLLAKMLLQFEDFFGVLCYAREVVVLNELEGSVEIQYPFDNAFKHLFLMDQLRLLKGASLVVQQFYSTSFVNNIPVFLYLWGIWNISFLGHPSRTKLHFPRTLEKDKQHGQLAFMAFYFFDALCTDKLDLSLALGSSTNGMLASSIAVQHTPISYFTNPDHFIGDSLKQCLHNDPYLRHFFEAILGAARAILCVTRSCMKPKEQAEANPMVLLHHDFDSSCLEWRKLLDTILPMLAAVMVLPPVSIRASLCVLSTIATRSVPSLLESVAPMGPQEALGDTKLLRPFSELIDPLEIKDLFIHSRLDLFAFLLVGVKTNVVESLVSQINSSELVLQYCLDDTLDVRKSAFKLLAHPARVGSVHLWNCLIEIHVVVAKQLNTCMLKETTLDKTCWEIGKLAIKVHQEIPHMLYLDNIFLSCTLSDLFSIADAWLICYTMPEKFHPGWKIIDAYALYGCIVKDVESLDLIDHKVRFCSVMEQRSIAEITRIAFEQSSMMVRCYSRCGAHMLCSFILRGTVLHDTNGDHQDSVHLGTDYAQSDVHDLSFVLALEIVDNLVQECIHFTVGTFCYSVVALVGLSFTPILHASGKEVLALDSLSFDYKEHLAMVTVGGTTNTVPDSNLEDKVLFEDGRIVRNDISQRDTFGQLANYRWDPG